MNMREWMDRLQLTESSDIGYMVGRGGIKIGKRYPVRPFKSQEEAFEDSNGADVYEVRLDNPDEYGRGCVVIKKIEQMTEDNSRELETSFVISDLFDEFGMDETEELLEFAHRLYTKGYTDGVNTMTKNLKSRLT